MTEITKDMPFEEGLAMLGISFEELASNLGLLKSGRQQGVSRTLGEDISLEQAIQKYLNDIKNKPVTTRGTYEGVLMQFRSHMNSRWDELKINSRCITIVKRTDIELFLNSGYSNRKGGDGRISAQTFNKRLSVLSSFFKRYLMEDQQLISKSPTVGVQRRPEGGASIKFLTRDEQRRVLINALKNKETGSRDFVLIFLALNTGPRLDEIVSLTINDIDIRGNVIYIRRGKGDKPREIFLNDEIKQVLIKYLKTLRLGPFRKPGENMPLFQNMKGPNNLGPLSRHAAEKMVVRVFRRSGISTGAMHRLRHSFAVNALESGLNIAEIMVLLGHTNVTTTVKYLTLSNEQILKKIKTNFPLAFCSIKNIFSSVEEVKTAKMADILEGVGIDDCNDSR